MNSRLGIQCFTGLDFSFLNSAGEDQKPIPGAVNHGIVFWVPGHSDSFPPFFDVRLWILVVKSLPKPCRRIRQTALLCSNSIVLSLPKQNDALPIVRRDIWTALFTIREHGALKVAARLTIPHDNTFGCIVLFSIFYIHSFHYAPDKVKQSVNSNSCIEADILSILSRRGMLLSLLQKCRIAPKRKGRNPNVKTGTPMSDRVPAMPRECTDSQSFPPIGISLRVCLISLTRLTLLRPATSLT